MLLNVTHESLPGGLPFFVRLFRLRLAFSMDGFVDSFFQFGKKALALGTIWALRLVHLGLL